jgi:uncharacterized membrane protein YoaK (UPF0700 family)
MKGVRHGMLIREGTARSLGADRRLACALAAVAGGLNTAAFRAVGFFSANMTGNVSLASDHVTSGEIVTGMFFLLIVFTFIAGAWCSTLVVELGKRRQIVGMYLRCIVAEAGLLTLLGIIEFWLAADLQGRVFVLGLSFLMGLQNAIVTQISDARVRTTHISGMATDIGIGLAKLWVGRLTGESRDRPSQHGKLLLHTETVLAFFVGGVVGVLAYNTWGYSMVFVAAGALLLLAAPGLRQLRNSATL